MKRRQFIEKIFGAVIGLVSIPIALKNEMKIGKWHHFVYQRVGDVEEIYLDGKKVTSIVVNENYEILKYRREQVGVIVDEEFWFRKTDNAKSLKT